MLPENKPNIAVRQALEDYRYAILTLSPKSQANYLERLQPFADWCEARQITLDTLRQTHIRQYSEYLRTRPGKQRGREGQPLASVTCHSHMLVIKIFLHWCSQEEDYEDCVSKRLADRVELPKIESKVIETFSPEQIKAVLEACKRSNTPTLAVRNTAIVLVLLDTGIRASELCSLTLDCCYLDPYDSHLKVHGKGNKWREVPLGRRALTALRRYITRYRKSACQSLFLARTNEPLSLRGLQQTIADLGVLAGVSGVRCSPHTFRHTFAVNYLAESGDLFRLMRLMGHTDIKMTQRYLRAFQDKQARSSGMSIADRLLQ